MSLELLDEQADYAERVAELSGLDHDVLRAWVAAASGPGVRVLGGGYLEADERPRWYPSIEHAARAMARRLEQLELPARLTTAGPLGQLLAIGEHPDLPGDPVTLIRSYQAAVT